MKEKLTKNQTEKILTILDDLLREDDWQSSNFLRTINKKVQEIRDSVALHYQDLTAVKENTHTQAIQNVNELQKIFISLYASDGSLTSNWEWILANLPRQIVSRSIYANEIDVKALIKTKPNPVNEAYVSCMVPKEMIIEQPQEKIAFDKLGKPLMVLRDRALLLNNIIEFVHISGVYKFSEGKLVLK